MNPNIKLNVIDLNVINAIKQMRVWEENHLPVSQSRLSFDLFIFIAQSNFARKNITLKILFNSLKYSERGIRYALDYFIQVGWCEIVPCQSDKRFRRIRATELLIDKYNQYTNKFISVIEPGVLSVMHVEALRLSEQIADLNSKHTLSVLSAGFAHEFSQPLTAILLDIHTAKMALMTQSNHAAKLAQALDDVQNSTQSAVALLERIRNFIKLAQPHHQRMPLQPLVREVVHLMQSHAKAAEVQFETDLGDVSVWVWGDRVELAQVMVNVLRNAVESMQNSPHRVVTLRLTHAEECCTLQFIDTGTGLTTERFAALEAPFMTSKPEGFGVGFLIARAIAENHKGSLTITNVRDGGACVSLNLPKLKESPTDEP
jgi:hypothetical protein